MNSIAPLVLSLAALGVLLIGQVQPEPRLILSGIPVNTLIMGGCVICAVMLPVTHADRAVAAAVVLLLLPLALSVYWSREAAAGALKIFNLGASAVSAALMLRVAIADVGLQQVLRWWVAAFAALLVAAFFFKLRFGFFDRGVNFFLNGPIVFARIMGIAALAAAYVYRGWLRWLAIIGFAMAVIWTQSKGPFLALMLTAVGVGIFQMQGVRRGFAIATSLTVVLSIVFFLPYLQKLEHFGRFFLAASFLQQGIGGSNYGSVGSRVEMAEQSLQMIAAEPFGVGVGSWAIRTGNIWAEYPHNFFLEILSEGGILLGGLSSVAFFLFLRTPHGVLASFCWFLMISQQFSGDLLDARFWLAFSALALMRSGPLSSNAQTDPVTA